MNKRIALWCLGLGLIGLVLIKSPLLDFIMTLVYVIVIPFLVFAAIIGIETGNILPNTGEIRRFFEEASDSEEPA